MTQAAAPSLSPISVMLEGLRLIRGGGWRGAVILGFAALADAAIMAIWPIPKDGDFDDMLPQMAISTVISTPISSAAAAAAILLWSDAAAGRRASWRACARIAWRCVLPLSALRLITMLAIGAGFVVLILPGLWLMASWVALTPAMALEDQRWGAATRSAQLTRPARWRLTASVGALFALLVAPYFAISEIDAPPLLWSLVNLGAGLAIWALMEAAGLAYYRRLIAREQAIGPH